jgi:hypothetical protein
MLNKIKEVWNSWSDQGLKLPFVHDQTTKKPSVTLLTYYIMFLMTIFSLIALHFKIELIIATSITIISWVLSFIFYRLRRLNNAKIDLDDKTIELSSDKGSKEDVEDS